MFTALLSDIYAIHSPSIHSDHFPVSNDVMLAQ